jgi:hypothetical protein
LLSSEGGSNAGQIPARRRVVRINAQRSFKRLLGGGQIAGKCQQRS